MPGIILTPELARDITLANSNVVERIQFVHRERQASAFQRPFFAPAMSFLEQLQYQNLIYGQKFASQTLEAQIRLQFSADANFSSEANQKARISECNGLFFMAFDDAIYNSLLYRIDVENHEWARENAQDGVSSSLNSMLRKVSDSVRSLFLRPFTVSNYDNYYNAIPRMQWYALLRKLKRDRFLVILLTPRSPLVGEDALIQKIVYQDLANCFDRYLFTGGLGPKGYVIDFIRTHLINHHSLTFPWENIYLLAAEDANLASAAYFGVQTIRSWPEALLPETHVLMQMRHTAFIEDLLRVATPPPPLPPPSPSWPSSPSFPPSPSIRF